MKKTIITLMGMGLASFSAQAQIAAGDVIAIDFGNTATTEANWNTSVIATTADLVRLSDGVNTLVGVTIASVGGTPGNNNAVFSDGSAQGGSSVFEIYDDGIIMAGTGDDTITLTFTGLDDSLTYDLFAGGLTLAADFGASWDINTTADVSTTQETSFQNTIGYVDFTGITSVGGEFTLTINDLNDGRSPASGRNIGLNELTLTAVGDVAVPEPSSTALLGLGGLALLLRRRK